jgi:hypothetical protein
MSHSKRQSEVSGFEICTVSDCHRCATGRLARVHRETFADFVVSLFGFYPYACDYCNQRSLRVKYAQFTGAAAICVLVCCLMGAGGFYLHSAYVARAKERAAAAVFTSQQFNAAESNLFQPVSNPPAQADILTNQDVIKMVKTGMSSTLINNLIGRMENKFVIDSRALVELKSAHVPENVILNMVGVAKGESHSSTNSGAGR